MSVLMPIKNVFLVCFFFSFLCMVQLCHVMKQSFYHMQTISSSLCLSISTLNPMQSLNTWILWQARRDWRWYFASEAVRGTVFPLSPKSAPHSPRISSWDHCRSFTYDFMASSADQDYLCQAAFY